MMDCHDITDMEPGEAREYLEELADCNPDLAEELSAQLDDEDWEPGDLGADWTDYDAKTGDLHDLDASDFEGSEDELFSAATELMAMADDFDGIGAHDRAAMHRAEAEALMAEAEGLISGGCDD